MWDKCSACDRPMVCESNLKKLRRLVIGGTLGFGALGALALPLAGFGLSGIAAGSFAASWQSSIGAVATGSLFATLQSLGATGLGVLLFGGTSAALGLLGTLATRLNWCHNDCDYNSPLLKWEHCAECNKPQLNEPNLMKLRAFGMAGYLKESKVGADMLKIVTLRRDNAGDPNAWCSKIDTYAANRLFTVLKSLKENGLGVLFFGDTYSALNLLATKRIELNWCNCADGVNFYTHESTTENIILTNSLVPIAPFVSNALVINAPITATSTQRNETIEILKKLFNWKLCTRCKRPLICEINLWKIRVLVVGGALTGGVLGTSLLPLIGLGPDGISTESVAAFWQSSINIDVADILFSKLQGWSTSLKGKFLFGDLKFTVPLLASLVDELDWCKC